MILTGGTIRIPKLRQFLEHYFPNKIETTLNLDESIAKGCSIIGALQSNSISTKANVQLKYPLRHPVYLKWASKQPFTLIGERDVYPIVRKITIRDAKDLDIYINYDGENYEKLVDIRLPKDVITEKDDYLKVVIEYGLDELCRINEICLYQPRTVKVLEDNQGNMDSINQDQQDTQDNDKCKPNIKTKDKTLKVVISHEKPPKIISDKINKIKSFEVNAEQIRVLQVKRETIRNDLENSYYTLQDKFLTDSDFKTYLSKEELETQKNLVNERLDHLYETLQKLDTLEIYRQELQGFYDKIKTRKDNDQSLQLTIKNLQDKYTGYREKLSNMTRGPHNSLLHEFQFQVENEWKWFQEVYSRQQGLPKWADPVLTSSMITDRLTNLENMFTKLEKSLQQ